MSLVFYPAIVESGTSGYGVFFPDLPGCTSAGNTVQAAARNAQEALRGHLRLMIEDSDPIPMPSELDTIERDLGAAYLIAAKTGEAARPAAKGAATAKPKRSATAAAPPRKGGKTA